MSTSRADKSLRWLLEAIDSSRLVLPEIQRDFVWKKKSVELLFDSLYRDLPIGSLLVWKATTPVPQRHFSKGGGLADPRHIDNFYGYLLDGQQRLTALRLVRDGEIPLYFYAWPDRAQEGYGHFHSTSDGEWSVNVGDVLSGKFSIPAMMKSLQKAEGYSPDLEDRIHDELVALQQLVEREVSIIEFETGDYVQATEVFIRINATGRKLGKDDLSAAQLALAVPELISGALGPATRRYAGFPFTIPFLVRCLVAVHLSKMPKGVVKFEDAGESVRKSWEQTEKALDSVVTFVSGVVKWQHLSLIPSINALVPLVYLSAQSPKVLTGENARFARRWLLLASLRGSFSKSVGTELDRLVRALSRDPSVETLTRAGKQAMKKITAADFEGGGTAGARMALFLSMIRDADARDWLHSDLALDGTVAGKAAALHVHHFFPRALLNKYQYDRRDIDTFANYTVLSATTNLDVGQEEPGSYLPRLGAAREQLEKQCIPMDSALWRVDRYEDFLKERKRLLALSANRFLDA